jgi:hypothetical protein
MPEERSLDPRFDPRYQRGFDPSTMPVEPETVRAPVEQVAPLPPASPVSPRPTRHQERLEEDQDEEGDEEFEQAPTRNPFRLALLLLSIGFLALAAAILWWTANNQSAYLYGSAVETAQGWMFQSLTASLPAAAIVAGFVGLAIWLGLGALSAQADANDRSDRDRGE